MSKNPISNTSKRAIVPETPRSQKSFGQEISLTDLRNQIAKEMDGEFIRCPVDAFIKAYLPFAPNDEDMDYFIKKLLPAKPEDSGSSGSGLSTRNETRPKASILVGEEPNLLFRRYLDKDITRTSSGSEIVAYGHWSDIAAEISKIPYPENKRKRNKFTYVNMPSKQIESNIPGSNNKIDAAFIAPCDESRKFRTHDIAVVIEHKLDVQKKRENALQAVSANVQVMNDDARRMFTFGITAESNEVTLWYHSRSHSAASERFRFTQDPKTFIQVLIAFLFATEEELGYDPMVSLEADGNYIFKVPDPQNQDQFHRFQTIEALSFYRSNNITGRMARVYKASRINETGEAIGEPVVLKDVWLDESAQTERDIQTAIFADIEKFWSSSEEPAELKRLKNKHKKLVKDGSYKKHFLEIVQDHQGRVTHPLADGASHERGLLAPPDLSPHIPRTGTRTAASSPDDDAAVDTHPIPSNLPPRPVIPRTYVRKKQYRVVFKEVCKTVGKLETLGEVVNVLYQSLTPLQLLFCGGWVHRDVSSGNILAYRKNLNVAGPWAAKLSDLEYAKRFPAPDGAKPASDPKTGTPYFMPLEVMLQAYIHSIEQDEISSSSSSDEDSESENIEEFVDNFINKPRPAAVESTVVVHNFQHDLESIWWILLWTICYRLDPAESTESLQNFGKSIFVNKMRPSAARMDCFVKKTFDDKFRLMAPESILLPVASLANLRKNLYRDYIRRSRKGAYGDIGSYAKIHRIFNKVFKYLDGTASNPWSSIQLPAVKTTNTTAISKMSSLQEPERKRARSYEDDIDPRTIENEGRNKAKQLKRV